LCIIGITTIFNIIPLFGAKTDPCGTPKRSPTSGDVLSATETHWVLSVRYDFTQVKDLSLKCREFLLLCGVESLKLWLSLQMCEAFSAAVAGVTELLPDSRGLWPPRTLFRLPCQSWDEGFFHVTMRAIKSDNDLTTVPFSDRSQQLDNSILEDDLGDVTSTRIFANVRKFFLVLDDVLRDLAGLNPDPALRESWSSSSVPELAIRVGLVTDKHHDPLVAEFQDYQLTVYFRSTLLTVVSTSSGRRWQRRRHALSTFSASRDNTFGDPPLQYAPVFSVCHN